MLLARLLNLAIDELAAAEAADRAEQAASSRASSPVPAGDDDDDGPESDKADEHAASTAASTEVSHAMVVPGVLTVSLPLIWLMRCSLC